MDNLNYVLQRMEAGANVRFLMDYYGRETVEVDRAWLMGRARLRLAPKEIEQLKSLLRDRRRRPALEERPSWRSLMRLPGTN